MFLLLTWLGMGLMFLVTLAISIVFSKIEKHSGFNNTVENRYDQPLLYFMLNKAYFRLKLDF